MRWRGVGPTLVNLKGDDDVGSFGIEAKPAILIYLIAIILLVCYIVRRGCRVLVKKKEKKKF